MPHTSVSVQPIVIEGFQLIEAAEILLSDSYLDGASEENVAQALSVALYEFLIDALADPSHFVSRHGSDFHRALRSIPQPRKDTDEDEADFSQAA